MMNTPLSISSIAEHVCRFHGDREIVSVTLDNPRHRYSWRDAIGRSKRLANALTSLGIKPGTTTGTSKPTMVSVGPASSVTPSTRACSRTS